MLAKPHGVKTRGFLMVSGEIEVGDDPLSKLLKTQIYDQFCQHVETS